MPITVSSVRGLVSAKVTFAVLLALTSSRAFPQAEVLTRAYDNYRTGANTSEKTFTPEKVRANGMKKLFSLNLENDDPRVEAQPLYVPGLVMSDQKAHDVVFVFSMANNAYAFDINTGQRLWLRSLGAPFRPDPADPVDIHHINAAFGILSTPVIDRSAGLIYLVNWSLDQQGERILRVNALRLSNGTTPSDREPLPIAASITNVSGQSVRLDQVQKQRAALLLTPLRAPPGSAVHKYLYVAFTGADDPPPEPDPTKVHHGWIIAFDTSAWKQVGAWVSTPSSFGGGIWQGAAGLAADDDGNIYGMTSNGGFLPVSGGTVRDFVGTTDFAESFVKLAYNPERASLLLLDWFAPFRDSQRKRWRGNEVAPFPRGYNYADQDLGSAGPILPPGTNLLLGAGKDGVLYILDRNHLGMAVGDLSKLKAPPRFITFEPDQTVTAYRAAAANGNLDFKPSIGVKTHHLHSSPIYWKSIANGPMLYVWGENAALRAFSLRPSGAKLLARGTDIASRALADSAKPNLGGMPGGMLTLSADGETNGIVWATAPIDGDANMQAVPGAVRAYDASNFQPGSAPSSVKRLRRLWEQTGFTYSKFCPPVVVDGKLIVPTYDGRVDVYVLNTSKYPAH